MEPTPDATAATPRRQSCDRCHGQKLRCTRRDSHKSGACERCLRKGAVCVYSSSLPKGRPSLYRLGEVPPAPSSPSSSTASSSAATARRPGAVPNDTRPLPESPTATIQFPTTPVTPVQTGQQPGDTQIDPQTDLEMAQGNAYDLSHSVDSLPNFWPSWWQDDSVRDSMLGIVPTPMPSFDLDPALEAQAALSPGLDGLLPGNHSGASAGHVRENESCPGFSEKNDTGDSNMIKSSHVDVGPAISTMNNHGFELSIVHLSQLSMRLSQLLSSSRSFLVEGPDPSRPFENENSAGQLQLGIEAVFKSVNHWLVQGLTRHSPDAAPSSLPEEAPQSPFDLLQHMFAASNHLLEILRNVRVSTTETSAASSSQASTAAGDMPNAPTTTVSAAKTTTPGDPPEDPSSQASSVVHQLVIVCVTLLLNMYVTILTALQRSANTLYSQQAHKANTVDPAQGLLEPPCGPTMHDTERAHLQLVTVVQLCASFIRRQNQTLDLLLAGIQAPKLQDPRGSLESVRELKAEVEQRLRWMQDSLYMVS